MSWLTPKTNWTTDDAIGTTDLNRIEGNTADLDSRAISQDGRITGLENLSIRAGRVNLFAGEGVIADSGVTANTICIAMSETLSGAGITVGHAFFVNNRSIGTSITIKSDSALDASTVGYILIEP